MTPQKTKPKSKLPAENLNPFENIMKGAVSSFSNDLLKGGGSEMWDELLGLQENAQEQHHKAGDLAEGQELDLSKKSESNAHIEAGIDYHRDVVNAGKHEMLRERQEIHVQVQQIQVELKQIMAMSKELQSQFKQAATEQRVVVAGKYHETFFAWLLTTIREARRKIEDAGAWLSAAKGKKKKQDYWSQFKDKGTSFAMSNERNVATQVG